MTFRSAPWRALAFALPLQLAAPWAAAQAGPADFPEGATALAPDALKESLAGKVFTVNAAAGPAWRWEFKGNGYFFINIGGFSDSGKWHTKDSTLCTEGRQIKAGCNEVRHVAGTLQLKRDSGEVIKLVPQ